MQFPLMHSIKCCDHREIEHTACLSVQRLVAPDRAPAVFGQQLLKITGEFAGISQCIIYILSAEHVAACRQTLVKPFLVHRNLQIKRSVIMPCSAPG